MSAQLVGAIDDTITVEYGQFTVQEVDSTRIALELGIPTSDWFVIGGPGGLHLQSAGTDHYPAVRIEVWNGEPAQDPAKWDSIEVVQCHLLGPVRLESVTAEQSEKILDIREPGSHNARVHVAGKRKTAKLAEGTFAKNKERWLIQLWAVNE
jgi:hypothetical protein